MEKEKSEMSRREKLGTEIIGKVGDIISVIKDAKLVDQVICALHSLAIFLFPLDSILLSGSLDQRYKNQVLEAKVPTRDERGDWWRAFYGGAAFPALARILLYDVASNWLACFSISARKHVYDSFFINGPSTETVQALVPVLSENGINEDVDPTSVCSNAERMLVLCLLENDGVRHMAREFGDSSKSEECADEWLKPDKLAFISRVAQLVASIPDKASLEAPVALSSHLFFKQITVQLLSEALEREVELYNGTDTLDKTVVDGTFLFVGETFSRICRRGSADVVLVEIIPRILEHVRSFSSSIDPDEIESKAKSQLWMKIVEAIRDPYAVERFSEELLRQLATEHLNDTEAYWTLWMLFHRTFKHERMIRAMFRDKFLLWKVFPVCCLRWILQFSVLECPPSCTNAMMEGGNTGGLLDTLQRLVGIWSKREFVQSASMEQQAYITAAVGLCLENMSKEELEATKDIMNPLLHGVSCRLESPIHLVRKMASCVALAFSKVIDPKNPLYLDDSCNEETIDWEFGLTTLRKRIAAPSNGTETAKDEVQISSSILQNGVNGVLSGKGKTSKVDKELREFRLVDPNEIIDPATLNNDNFSDGDESQNSETLSDSSLQPYDLSDDDTDLKRNFSQLGDIISALRKSDDPDGVEGALDVAEKLIRASPNELQHVSSDLTRALVHVHCSHVTVEEEEDSAEEKRQRALVALLVTCPFESLDALTKLLYSPNVDVSQRILILDVMTNAAQELANAKSTRVKHQERGLISTVSENQPWFFPPSRGPSWAGPWEEVSETGTVLSFTHRYERKLPSKSNHIKSGKSRRWSLQSTKIQENQHDWSKNTFPIYAAAFMLPVMQGYDKKRHGVDLLGRDFIVLGKLIYLLGVCMKCTAMHPEASALAPALLDMLSSRQISHHVEAYVRRSVLFAASCILVALHPSYVASSLLEGNLEISKGLEWIRMVALHIAESDSDAECSTMAMTCLQLHAEMALQASRSLESADPFKAKSAGITSNLLKGTIIMPHSTTQYQN
ncbi:embryo defective 2423 isoform X2 [Tasmannia lanceolata]